MNNSKLYTLIGVVVVIAGSIYLINSKSVMRGSSSEVLAVTPRPQEDGQKIKNNKSQKYEIAKEITTPDGFINTDGKPITINELIGKKVILIDFWTNSCINCQRTTPYLNAWHEKYKDKGLALIGIHTPEFEFEKKYDQVKSAVEKFGIKFPVVLDNDYSTWSAYKNRYWPRKYLIDIDGYIVYDHIGEGKYEETERKIQEALSERIAILGETEKIDQPLTQESPTVANGPGSHETYFGASRNEFFANGKAGIVGIQKNLVLPKQLKPDVLYLVNDWDINSEFAQNVSPAKIVYRYNAKDVFLVSQSDQEIVVEVTRNGKPLGAEAGANVVKTSDGKTLLKIKEAQLYKIIQDNQSGTHNLELIIPRAGLKAFAFTFG